jgi:hypothetical protein
MIYLVKMINLFLDKEQPPPTSPEEGRRKEDSK